jgi:hypothetical protein
MTETTHNDPRSQEQINRILPNQWRSPEPDTVEALILDLLEWIGPNPRRYAEVLDAWKTSCPRLPVWEDANDRGFLARHHSPGRGALIAVSATGVEHLRKHRPPPL